MGDGRGSSPRVEPWVIDWLCLRQPAGGIDRPHLPNELDQLTVLASSPRPMPGLPAPEGSEPRSLPADDGLRSEDDQGGTPVGPSSFLEHPEQAVVSPQSGLVHLPMEHRNLLPEGETLQGEIMLGTEPAHQVA
jgi:hypothetical protein